MIITICIPMSLSSYVVQNFRIGIILIPFLTSCGNKNILEEVKPFPSYPSASGIQYLNNQLYIIGDDAKNILIVDSSLNTIDSITLYPFSEQRIPKSLKPDLESITITKNNKLLLLGSGSLAPYRSIGWLIDPSTKEKELIHLDTFYNRLRLNNISELNIEGSCALPGYILLSNRGHKENQKNHLILTSHKFWEQQSESSISIIILGGNKDSVEFQGVSGLTYAEKSDLLLMTISTEDTKNAVDDGAIGKSYLWIVNNLTSKLKWKAINPSRIIDLEKVDTRFKNQKIESVCITKETRNFLHLVLAADNDKGSSALFKLVVEKD